MNWEEKYRALSELVDGYRRERDEANARRADLRTALEWSNKERDEARAEVERMKARPVEAEYAELDIMWQRLVRERDDAYRAKRDAYRRGAEAMRGRVINWLVQAQAEATVLVVDTAIRGVLKLPIPEDQ